jgi:prophage antirepressor-like protein
MATELQLFDAFVLGGQKYDVQVIEHNGKPAFRAEDVGKVLGMVNIRPSIGKYDGDERVVIHVNTVDRNILRDVTFLTERGLYRLLMNSRKPIARPFQRWVAEVVETIREKGRCDLQKAKEDAELRTSELLLQQAELTKRAASVARHDALVSAFGKGQCLVYFGKIRNESKRELIKIGSTKDIRDRIQSLAKEFGSMEIFEVFPVAMFRQFEEFLQHHPRIEVHAFKDPVYNGHRSNGEVFLMSPVQIQTAVNIAKRHVAAFNDVATTEQIVELELTRLKTAMIEQKPAEPLDSTGVPVPYYIPPPDRRYTQARGMKVQRYDAEGKTLLATYAGLADITRDPSLAAPVGPLAKQAASQRTLYKGFRWAMLDRNLPDDTFQEIGETVKSRTANKGLIAMVDLDMERIV